MVVTETAIRDRIAGSRAFRWCLVHAISIGARAGVMPKQETRLWIPGVLSTALSAGLDSASGDVLRPVRRSNRSERDAEQCVDGVPGYRGTSRIPRQAPA
jgi:hypothetical protein